ncbi:hypothetical protein FGADI_10090 [Fusarium gaditjirri]|uniref:2EXR domain-containing protein n=1 Tax=Fusarium gaditjirri TaxID=282569 RepID=A0A8H4WS60_9HYPO|nr:hypothetical protein FGADI_10090 [Fusarium gaditjirri]
MLQIIQKLFKRQSRKSDSEPQGAFHRFTQLPQEIQNLIWSYALCADAPRAYFVDVKSFFGRPREVKLIHSIPKSLGDFPLPPDSNPESDYDLMRVCRSSYQEISRCWTLYRPRVPTKMILDNSHDNATRVKELSSLFIDAASDLIIIEGWYRAATERDAWLAGIPRFVPLWAEGPFRGLEAIKRLAIPVEIMSGIDSWYMEGLEDVFPGLQTVYLYIQPIDIVPLKSRRRRIPVDFCAAEPPQRFRARGRIFYVICPEKMRG